MAAGCITHGWSTINATRIDPTWQTPGRDYYGTMIPVISEQNLGGPSLLPAEVTALALLYAA